MSGKHLVEIWSVNRRNRSQSPQRSWICLGSQSLDRRPMSTAAVAPERVPLKAKGNAPRGEQRSFSYHRQLICAICLLAADALAILISLRLAIFLRASWIPRVDTNLSPLKLPLSHYLDFGWLWVLLMVFLGVEGLYTQRRTLWN